jgi:hypothetical protein
MNLEEYFEMLQKMNERQKKHEREQENKREHKDN